MLTSNQTWFIFHKTEFLILTSNIVHFFSLIKPKILTNRPMHLEIDFKIHNYIFNILCKMACSVHPQPVPKNTTKICSGSWEWKKKFSLFFCICKWEAVSTPYLPEMHLAEEEREQTVVDGLGEKEINKDGTGFRIYWSLGTWAIKAEGRDHQERAHQEMLHESPMRPSFAQVSLSLSWRQKWSTIHRLHFFKNIKRKTPIIRKIKNNNKNKQNHIGSPSLYMIKFLWNIIKIIIIFTAIYLVPYFVLEIMQIFWN